MAGRIATSNLHKTTSSDWEEVLDKLYFHVNTITGEPSPILSDEVYATAKKNIKRLQNVIDYGRDFNFDYFGFKTLEKSYLTKLNGIIVERPQHMLMRVSIGIHKEDIESVIITYTLTSQGYFTHATPTLFNSGTCRPQMSSCFLLTMIDDSIEGIYETLKRCALISKEAGG